MTICNCGTVMKLVERDELTKTYHCSSCYKTLIVDNRGLRRIYDKNGNPCSYNPPYKGKTEIQGGK